MASRVEARIKKVIEDLGLTKHDTYEDVIRKLQKGAKKSPFIRKLLDDSKDGKSPFVKELLDKGKDNRFLVKGL